MKSSSSEEKVGRFGGRQPDPRGPPRTQGLCRLTDMLPLPPASSTERARPAPVAFQRLLFRPGGGHLLLLLIANSADICVACSVPRLQDPVGAGIFQPSFCKGRRTAQVDDIDTRSAGPAAGKGESTLATVTFLPNVHCWYNSREHAPAPLPLPNLHASPISSGYQIYISP